MPTPLIQVGVVTAILQNVVYALPGRAHLISSVADVEGSVDNSTWDAIASGTLPVLSSYAFVRCTTGNTSIVCKIQ
jgi:hypothetical protein